MIAFKRRRGPFSAEHRAAMSKAMTGRPSACQAGGATSAAKMNRVPGTVGRHPWVWLWIPGEGWLRWTVLAEQVREAHRQWRIKKSIQGVMIQDGWEWRQAQIAEQVAKRDGVRSVRAVRSRWLAEWARKHRELEERAA